MPLSPALFKLTRFVSYVRPCKTYSFKRDISQWRCSMRREYQGLSSRGRFKMTSHFIGRRQICMSPQYSKPTDSSLQWRHNEHDGVWNHRRLGCLHNCLFRRRSKKISKFCVTDLCEGNPPVTGGFPSQRVSNAENVSIRWRHHFCHCKHRRPQKWGSRKELRGDNFHSIYKDS